MRKARVVGVVAQPISELVDIIGQISGNDRQARRIPAYTIYILIHVYGKTYVYWGYGMVLVDLILSCWAGAKAILGGKCRQISG